MNAVVEAQYFPPVAFFSLYLKYEKVKIVKDSRFEKQSYRNRCEILGANKVQSLVVPVQKGKTKMLQSAVKVVDTEPWRVLHWRSILSAYGKAPFFEHYAPDLKAILDKDCSQIFDLNVLTIRWAEKILQLAPVQIVYKKTIDPERDDVLINAIHPKRKDRDFTNQLNFGNTYFQCFTHSGFVPNLSVIDLIMNEGPMGIEYLRYIK